MVLVAATVLLAATNPHQPNPRHPDRWWGVGLSILLGPHRCVTPRHTGPSPSWDGGIAPACRRQHSARPVVGVWRSNSWRHTAPSPNGAAAPAQSGAPAGRDSELPDLLVDHITPSTRPDSAPRCHDPAPSPPPQQPPDNPTPPLLGVLSTSTLTMKALRPPVQLGRRRELAHCEPHCDTHHIRLPGSR